MAFGQIIGQTPVNPKTTANNVAYDNSKTSSIITGQEVQTAIDELGDYALDLFTSVSNGKNKIASAITDKGVSTSGNSSFDVMAQNIGKIESELKQFITYYMHANALVYNYNQSYPINWTTERPIRPAVQSSNLPTGLPNTNYKIALAFTTTFSTSAETNPPFDSEKMTICEFGKVYEIEQNVGTSTEQHIMFMIDNPRIEEAQIGSAHPLLPTADIHVKSYGAYKPSSGTRNYVIYGTYIVYT